MVRGQDEEAGLPDKAHIFFGFKVRLKNNGLVSLCLFNSLNTALRTKAGPLAPVISTVGS